MRDQPLDIASADQTALIDRINALTANARGTWFALLGTLAFIGVTLLGVSHIDFYGVDRATPLPLIGVSIPTATFFFTAPLITAVFYGYFHVQLIRLWDALALAEQPPNAPPLARQLSPWLLIDMGLQIRHWRRQDHSTEHRALETASSVLNLALAWIFGLVVAVGLWWLSMPARHFGMTLIAATALWAMLIFGYASLWVLWRRMNGQTGPQRITHSNVILGILILVAPALLITTHSRTVDPSAWIPLAPISLVNAQITQRPDGWQRPTVARATYRATYCAREEISPCKDMSKAQEDAFQSEWTAHRNDALADLTRPNLNPLLVEDVAEYIDDRLNQSPDVKWPSKDWYKILNRSAAERARRAPDLRGADLRGSFLADLNVTAARLSGADLSGANLEHATLAFADLSGANTNLSRAILTRANLSWAQLQEADFREAQLQEANLIGAQLQEADLSGAQLQEADLRRAQLQEANLIWAQLQEANLSWAQLQEANLWGAQLQEANLWGAQLQEANLGGAQLQEANLGGAQLQEANLWGAQLQGANLRGAQLQEANLWGAQLTGADFSQSYWTGHTDKRTVDTDTNLRSSWNVGGALRAIDLSRAQFDASADWRNVFLDASVTLSPYQRQRMGNPCHWADTILSDQDFFGRWRGWLEAGGVSSTAMPPILENVTPIPPPKGCTWATGPLRPEHGAGR